MPTQFSFNQTNGNVVSVNDVATNIDTALELIASGDLGAKIYIPDGTHTVDDGCTITDYPFMLEGAGSFQDKDSNVLGSIIDNSAGTANTFLTIDSSPTRQSGTTLKDFALLHQGSGAGIVINDTYDAVLDGLFVFCQNVGATGIQENGSSFLTTYKRLTINGFTNYGILLDPSEGTMRRIRDCSIQSTQDTAIAAVEVRETANRVEISGGQINVNNSTNDGVGIRFNNTGGSLATAGGVVDHVLCEHGIAVEITGTTDNWRGIYIKNLELTGSNSTKVGVKFDRAVDCYMIDPLYSSTAGVLAEFTANANGCGIYCDLTAARNSLTVNASATDCFMHVKGRLSYSDRALVTTDSNLRVSCEHVEDLGFTFHNGSYWNKYFETINDDATVNYSSLGLPAEGVIEIKQKNGAAYIKAAWHASGMTGIATGLNSTVDATSGNLNGTTGADGDLTVRYNTSTTVLYVENRLGASSDLIVTFLSEE